MKPIILLPILLFHVTFVNCAYNATPHNNSTSSAANSAANSNVNVVTTRADSKLTIATGLVLSQIDLIACIYVLVRTYLQWKQNGKNPLPMSLRFPFYIALIEIWVSILQTVGLASLGPTGQSSQLCSFVGISSIFLLSFAGNLVVFISFIVWYKVKKNVNFNSGRYDYLLFVSSSILATFYTLLGVGEFGPSKFWCSPNPTKKPILYMILAIIIIHYIILLVLYLNTRINLIRLNVNLSSSNGQSTLSERELIISKKTTSYTLSFVFQITILLFCAILSVSITSENSAIHLLRMLGISIGGLLIALQYIVNEGWQHEKITSLPLIEKNSSGVQSTVSSLRGSIQRPFTRIQIQVVQQQTTTQNDDIW